MRNLSKYCIECKGDLLSDHVQQGGMHMSCSEKEINVYKVGPKANNKYCEREENLLDLLQSIKVHEEWTIERRRMTVAAYEALPEFSGF